MDALLDREYIHLISSRLEGFVQKRDNLWNCKCCICGDSSKSNTKKRMYFYQKKGAYFVICHNCGYSQPFFSFLRHIDAELYKKYLFEQFKHDKKPKKKKVDVVADLKKNVVVPVNNGFDYSSLIKFDSLPDDHPAKIYVVNRKIPLDRVLYCKNFFKFICTTGIRYYKEQFEHLCVPKLIIPFYQSGGISDVFQARTFDPNFKPKYITIKQDDDAYKIFGLDRVNPHRKVFVLEGPIDSMFLDNAVAFSGISADMPDFMKRLERVYFLDNEPRNLAVVKAMKKLITGGEQIVILDNVSQKDVNDMILAGINVEKLFKHSIYQGMSAELKIGQWKRC